MFRFSPPFPLPGSNRCQHLIPIHDLVRRRLPPHTSPRWTQLRRHREARSPSLIDLVRRRPAPPYLPMVDAAPTPLRSPDYAWWCTGDDTIDVQ
jgi:hypothetical protein